MRAVTIIGVLLIAFGIFALAYQGITYTHRKKVVDIGPIQATEKETKTVPLPPVLGVTALAGGVILVIAGSRRRIA